MLNDQNNFDRITHVQNKSVTIEACKEKFSHDKSHKAHKNALSCHKKSWKPRVPYVNTPSDSHLVCIINETRLP